METVTTKYLTELVPEESFDIAVATWWETAYYINQIKALHYAYLVQGNETEFYVPGDPRREFVQQTFQENFLFLTVSKTLQKHLRREYSVESRVVCNPIAPEPFNSPHPAIARNSSKRILVEGDPNWPLKRIDYTFNILDSFPDLEVIWVSPIECAVDQWPRARRFQRLPYSLIPAVFSSCDLILKLSATESFSRPVMEMFGVGGTAIVSDFQGHSDYIKHEENALVVPVDDAEATKSAIRRLLLEPELFTKLKNGAKNTYREWQTIDGSLAMEEAFTALRKEQNCSAQVLTATKDKYMGIALTTGSACHSLIQTSPRQRSCPHSGIQKIIPFLRRFLPTESKPARD